MQKDADAPVAVMSGSSGATLEAWTDRVDYGFSTVIVRCQTHDGDRAKDRWIETTIDPRLYSATGFHLAMDAKHSANHTAQVLLLEGRTITVMMSTPDHHTVTAEQIDFVPLRTVTGSGPG